MYKKGAVLLTEKPFAFVLSSKHHSERCDFCFSRTELRKCTGCSFTHYCDRECQKNGWFYHKKECLNIKKVAPKIVPDAARLLGRIIIRLEKGGAHERFFYSKTKFRVFKDLMSHYNEIKNDKEKMEHFTSLQYVLHEFLGEELLPNAAELLGIYGRMVINTFSILDGEMQSIGSGIYVGASVIDHSCTPNAVAVFQGTTLFIRTLKDIPQLNWSNVFISYIDVLNLPSRRQKELETIYYFLCQCQRCLDVSERNEMTAIICQNSDCRNVVPGGLLDEVTCAKCGHKFSTQEMEKINDVVNFTEQQLIAMKDVVYLDVCRLCLSKQEGILYTSNICHVKILDMAMESCIALQNWEGALEYGLRVKESFRKYYGEFNPLYGIFLMKLGKISQLLNDSSRSRKLFFEAQNILLVTHGDRHPLVKNELHMYLQDCPT